MLDSNSPFAPAAPPGPGSRNSVAAQRLRQAFVTCEIAPGAHVGEAEIAQRFGLGRAAVRTALTALAAAGFVLRHPRQGWQAAPVVGATVGEIVAARRRLEPALVERPLVERELPVLQSLARLAAAAIAANDRKALSTARIADRQIMETLARGSGAMMLRWLGEAWDHAARLAHLIDQAGALLWPSDREPLIAALTRNDRAAALVEIERDIAHLETAALRALLASQASLTVNSPRRSARRRRKAVASREIALPQPTIER